MDLGRGRASAGCSPGARGREARTRRGPLLAIAQPGHAIGAPQRVDVQEPEGRECGIGRGRAEALVDQRQDPGIRDRIVANAEERAWVIDRDRLVDRHIVRRMALKRCVYGVDKNPMAVELAKVALWLRTFTVGAPLSFLDHHLRCGDSLFWRMGTGRGRQGDRVWQPVASARLCHPGGTCRAGNADYRGVDRRRDRRGAPLRRDPLRQVCAAGPPPSAFNPAGPATAPRSIPAG